WQTRATRGAASRPASRCQGTWLGCRATSQVNTSLPPPRPSTLGGSAAPARGNSTRSSPPAGAARPAPGEAPPPTSPPTYRELLRRAGPTRARVGRGSRPHRATARPDRGDAGPRAACRPGVALDQAGRARHGAVAVPRPPGDPFGPSGGVERGHASPPDLA